MSSSSEQLQQVASSSSSSSSSQQELQQQERVVLVARVQRIPSWFIGLVIRIAIAIVLPLVMDDTNVPYTDIDYYVFTDAAEYVQNGYSPYNRTTYRYTPFLAYSLSKLPYQRYTTRFIFCIADTICGWIIVQIRQRIQKQRHLLYTNTDTVQQPSIHNGQQEISNNKKSVRLIFLTFLRSIYLNDDLIDAMWWLYNPLPINICTRGSAESLVVLLPVLITLYITIHIIVPNKIKQKMKKKEKNRSRFLTRPIILTVIAGICHGISIHAKLYPIIYTLSYMAFLVSLEQQQKQQQDQSTFTNKIRTSNNSLQLTKQQPSIIIWIYRWIIQILQSPMAWIFGLVAAITVILLTYLSVLYYGPIALQEGLLYHFSRVDHRHNYSMHWYWIYLMRYIQEEEKSIDGLLSISTSSSSSSTSILASLIQSLSMSFVGRILLVPQLIVLIVSSLQLAPYNLSLALFVQTFVFVTQNKVITAQYFTWYLCILPLCSSTVLFQSNLIDTLYSVLLLLGSIIIWLLSAYCLEMLGMAVHIYVWIASILFYLANVNLLRSLLSSIAQPLSSSSTTTTATTATTTTTHIDIHNQDDTMKKRQ